MVCPICGSRCIGCIGQARFFCADCDLEIDYTGSKQVYAIGEEGNLRYVGALDEVIAIRRSLMVHPTCSSA